MVDGEVRLWRLDTVASVPGDDAEVLAAGELGRAERFRRPSDRRDWVASRALLRRVLGYYLDRPAAEIAFVEGPDGKPGIDGAGSLHFNLSHSAGLAVVAVTTAGEVGVDVERRRADLDCLALARTAFGDDAADALSLVEPARRSAEFFRMWVRREAVGKCLGTGLGAAPVPEPAPWVAEPDVAPGYAAAVAVLLAPQAPAPGIVVTDARPLLVR